MLDSFHYTRDDPFVKGVTPKENFKLELIIAMGLISACKRSVVSKPEGDARHREGTLVLRNSQRDFKQGMVTLILRKFNRTFMERYDFFANGET